MYKNIELLPPIVKAALPNEKDQRRWAHIFNMHYQPGQYEEAMTKAFEAFKEDPNCRYFEGWLSVDGVDKQGDVMDQKALHKALKKFIQRGGTLVDTHTNRVLGGLFSVQLKKYNDKYEGNYGRGVLYQGEPYWNAVWEEVKKGEKNSFSIGGFALDWKEECDGWQCHRRVTDESIHELSLCRVPAHEWANMTTFNQLAKAEVGNDPTISTALGDEELMKSNEYQQKCLRKIEYGANKILNWVHEIQAAETSDDAGIKPLEKVGTVEGACRHHRQHNHRMTSKCTGKALDVSDDDRKEEPEDDVRADDAREPRPVNYEPTAFVDEEKKKEEHARADKYVHKHSGVKRVNDKQARALADKVRAMRPEGLPKDAAACYDRAIRILEDNSGLPVSKRLSIIIGGAKSECEKKTAIKISARLRAG